MYAIIYGTFQMNILSTLYRPMHEYVGISCLCVEYEYSLTLSYAHLKNLQVGNAPGYLGLYISARYFIT